VSPPQLERRRRGGASGAAGEAAGPEGLQVRAVLLASENRRIPAAAIDLAGDIAKRSGAPVHVFSIARIWGTSFGFPNPGLFPSRREWEEQRENAGRAVARLERRGVAAKARVIGTRAGAKRIVKEAERLGCDAIVMGADPPAGALVRNFMWGQEPYRVRRRGRRARIPVFLVVDD
jgi:nucleotide-binding universal stress UspA family protein